MWRSPSRVVILTLIVFVYISPHAFAADVPPANSLFFTPDEARQINALAGKNGPEAARPEIHLGAIMYYGPNDWTLWLQGERWTPATEKTGLKILAVQPDEVHLAVDTAPDTPPREIVLRPNQTYRAATGEIVEGDSE